VFLKNPPKIRIILFVLPFLIWIYCFRPFYTRDHLIIGIDAQTACASANYFLNEIGRGVYPAWKPFTEWGRPDDFIIQVYGELNPFLLTVRLLELLGLPFFLSYFIYSIGYCFLGLVGFFLLTRRVTGHETASYAAMVLLMFSNLGTNIFDDILVILLFVPMAWFFYFVVRFLSEPDDVGWVGITFTLMILVSTYIPTMFLTVLLCVLAVFALVFPERWIPVVRKVWRFCLTKPWMVVGSAVCLAFCALPGLIWIIHNLSGEYVAAWRGAVNAVSLSMEKINQGGLASRRSVLDLFSNLDVVNPGECYVPIFAFIIVLLGAILRFNRKILFLIVLGFLLLGISAGDVSAVYVFLYNHVSFFKTFRNLHFILWFAIPVFLIFAAQLSAGLLDLDLRTPLRRVGMIVFVLIVHAIAAYVLSHQDRVILSSFWVIGSSAVFFSLYYADLWQRQSWTVPAALLVLIVIQPFEVAGFMPSLTAKTTTTDYVRAVHPPREFVPVFSFTRPSQSQDDPYEEAMSFSDVRDSSGFMPTNFLGLRWSFLLHEKMDRTVVSEYTRHKFIAYDGTQRLENEEASLGEVQEAFSRRSNVAFVAPPGEDFPPPVGGRAQIIEGNSSQLSVEKFDLNTIRFRTDFPSRKFLVYNDCFQKDWRAYVNGRPVQLLRANIAFKGLWLQAGKNTVEMRYRPWRPFLGFFLIFLFQAVLILLVVLAVRRNKGGRS
jgi:hypothetical protein